MSVTSTTETDLKAEMNEMISRMKQIQQESTEEDADSEASSDDGKS